MPTVLTAVRERADIASPLREYDVSKQITLVMPDIAALIVLLSKLRSEEVDDPEFYWYEKELLPRRDKINLGAGYSAAATSIVVDNGSYFRIGDIVLVERTKERLRVDNVSTNTLTITRSLGGTAAAAMLDNDDLMIIGSSNEEGAVSRVIKTVKEAAVYNYLQIVTTPFGVTKTEAASKQKTKKTREQMRQDELITHRSDIERTFFFGEKSLDTSGTHAERTTGGLLEFITNVYDFGGIPTEDEFERFLELAMRYGSKTKLFVCSRAWASEFDKWGRHKLQTTQDDTTYGIAIATYKSAHGTVKIIVSDVLEGSYFGYYGFLLDMKNISMCHLPGRKHVLETNIQANDEDSWKDQYKSEVGIKIEVAQSHYVTYFNQ